MSEYEFRVLPTEFDYRELHSECEAREETTGEWSAKSGITCKSSVIIQR